MVSEDAFRQISGKQDIDFRDIGDLQLKNIDRMIRTYQWPAARNQVKASLGEAAIESLSIAVLPFNNMSGDPEQEYFSDGIAEDIITELSRTDWLQVIARNTTFTFKGTAVDVTKVAAELGVRYVLEGSVRRARNQVRVTAQLIHGESGSHVWAERYDRPLDDIFAVQDEITSAVVENIDSELRSAERVLAKRKPVENLDAWENYQRGLGHLYSTTGRDIYAAREFLYKAIEQQAEYAPALAGLAECSYVEAVMGWAKDTKANFLE